MDDEIFIRIRGCAAQFGCKGHAFNENLNSSFAPIVSPLTGIFPPSATVVGVAVTGGALCASASVGIPSNAEARMRHARIRNLEFSAHGLVQRLTTAVELLWISNEARADFSWTAFGWTLRPPNSGAN